MKVRGRKPTRGNKPLLLELGGAPSTRVSAKALNSQMPSPGGDKRVYCRLFRIHGAAAFFVAFDHTYAGALRA
jgi:hypothetical protein